MRATRFGSSNDVTPPRLYQIPSLLFITSSTCKRSPLTSSLDIEGTSALFSAGLEDSCAEAKRAAISRKRTVEANNFTKAVLFGKEHIVIRNPRRYNTSTAMGSS